jgi:bacteriophage HK97-gp10 putative tail-component
MGDPVVGLVGLNALARDIKRLAEDQASPLFEAMKAAGRQAAGPVADRARGTVPATDNTDHDGRLRGDIRVTATRTGAAVRMGRKTVPYAGWVEFGGTRKRPHTSSRDFVKGGRYLFPAAAGLAPVSAELYSAALAGVFGSGGVWTNTTTNPEAVRD